MEEWDSFPWWKQQAYLDGMNSFFNVQSGMDMYGNAVEQADDGDGDGYDYGDYDEGENILGGGEDDLSSLGFTVVKGG